MKYDITPGFHLTLPEKCGVYLYRDKDEHILYIGKAKNLKKRISTYFYNNKQHTSKTKRMVHAACSVELRFTASELEALLLEARLIRHHLPLYNRALRNYKAYPFIVLRTDLPYSYLEISRDAVIPGALYFGPYRRAHWLYPAVDALNSWLKLRRCEGALPSHSCLYADMKQCIAPCIDSSSHIYYDANVQKAIDVLECNPDMRTELERRRDESAAELRFEDAQQWQKLINLAQYNGQIKRSVARHHALVISTDPEIGYTGLVIVHGRLIATLKEEHITNTDTYTMLQQARTLYEQAKGTLHAPTVEEVDEMLIIASWLEYHTDKLTVYPLDIPIPV
ncbi:GIY-YIG nuclease family protein [Aneurinibacillus migulanus]|uniref:GIY-YIG nuclease family protein n=1 Tax=Aneurinibacillus migulanus TaxID=47500 RepID=UPI00209FED9E|nr:GIY-YIG nuclease family protein [Aneurinibacillus migulanus]MCP1358370.1 GIY-YIG nuclease family protein [Aneurinibacillus migulanus]